MAKRQKEEKKASGKKLTVGGVWILGTFVMAAIATGALALFAIESGWNSALAAKAKESIESQKKKVTAAEKRLQIASQLSEVDTLASAKAAEMVAVEREIASLRSYRELMAEQIKRLAKGKAKDKELSQLNLKFEPKVAELEKLRTGISIEVNGLRERGSALRVAMANPSAAAPAKAGSPPSAPDTPSADAGQLAPPGGSASAPHEPEGEE